MSFFFSKYPIQNVATFYNDPHNSLFILIKLNVMIIEIKVIPRSQENALVEFKQGILKIRVKGVPVKGKVNEALIKFLSDSFEIPKNQITIISGLTSQRKKVKILIDEKIILEKIELLINP